MTLDLSQTAAQLYAAASHFTGQRSAKLQALATAVTHLQTAVPQVIEDRRLTGHSTWLVAGMAPLISQSPAALTMSESRGAPPLAPDHVVVAVDGSHIDVDRHSPVRCFLINTGYVSLRYGEQPNAELYSTPSLFVGDDELSIRNPAGNREQPIEGPILGLFRAVMEIEALADLVETVPPDLPVLALLDGSLILWGLAGGAFPDYVRQALIDDRLLPALDRLKRMSESRTLAVASQISLPGSHEIVNALRIAPEVCGWPTLNCDGNCGALKRGERHCDVVAGVSDAELFDAVLESGERSEVFDTTSSVVEDFYGQHQVRFCYIHLGEEVCRLEMPSWSAEGPALDFAHAALLSQAAKGHGYPIALQEAHEQAVVSGADREYFAQLVEEMLVEEGLPTTTSQKSRSKRTRFI
ncbi:MAG: DNA double-strand break repair nuclease NurA [Chloroflexi bacterium]|nr:DNA double-strand break repair nuclease NurA [Chloroflexota bacterium]